LNGGLHGDVVIRTPDQRLRVFVSSSLTEVTGYLDGKKYVTHKLSEPVSGRVGLWSKADSYVLFDCFGVSAAK
jgi:hypothetical protein